MSKCLMPKCLLVLLQRIAEVLQGCGVKLAGLEFEDPPASLPPRKYTASTEASALSIFFPLSVLKYQQ